MALNAYPLRSALSKGVVILLCYINLKAYNYSKVFFGEAEGKSYSSANFLLRRLLA